MMSFLMSNRFLSCHISKVFDVPQSRCSWGFPARVAGRCGCGDVTALSCFLFDPMYHPRHGWKSPLKAVGHTTPTKGLCRVLFPSGDTVPPYPQRGRTGLVSGVSVPIPGKPSFNHAKLQSAENITSLHPCPPLPAASRTTGRFFSLKQFPGFSWRSSVSVPRYPTTGCVLSLSGPEHFQ